jgi:hypothetical protein
MEKRDQTIVIVAVAFIAALVACCAIVALAVVGFYFFGSMPVF